MATASPCNNISTSFSWQPSARSCSQRGRRARDAVPHRAYAQHVDADVVGRAAAKALVEFFAANGCSVTDVDVHTRFAFAEFETNIRKERQMEGERW